MSSDRLGAPLGSVGHHVRVCAEKGALELVKKEPVRGTWQHFYLLKVDESWVQEILGGDGTGESGLDEGGSA